MSNPKSRRAAVIAASRHMDLADHMAEAIDNGLEPDAAVFVELLRELGPEKVAEALQAYNAEPTSRRSAAALKARWGIRSGGSRWDAVASAAATVK
jgi:hypothetical protein